MWIPTLIATFVLYWIYDGYGRCLRLLCLLKRHKSQTLAIDPGVPAESLPSITLLLTVHNEASVIRQRLQNLLDCDYPAERFQILVASDGSTDDTNQIVRSFDASRVRLFESPGLGKTGTQNIAIRAITSDIIAFTDADIVFERNWLRTIAATFQDPGVGAVDGRLLYGHATETMQVSQGFYWNYELKLRRLESRLGILAVVAGACFAIRRNLFVPMDPAIGEDCIVPLDIVSQGFRVVHEPMAKAWDCFEQDSRITLRRRIRMTLRNWQGTWTRSALLNPIKHPGYAFALWSHKLLRWMSPVFLGTATLWSLITLIVMPTLLNAVIFAPYGLLFVMAGFGWRSLRGGLRIPGAGAAYSFVLANTAFLIGIWRAMTGHQIHSYRNA